MVEYTTVNWDHYQSKWMINNHLIMIVKIDDNIK